MRRMICLTAVLAFCAYPALAAAQATLGENPAPAAEPAPAAQAAPAAFQMNETTWAFTEDGTKIHESIDANGNYIANTADGKHLDHGTASMKGDKLCFTSAMNKDGEECWTTKVVDVGQSMETTSDKGRKLTVTRVAYKPMTMSQ